MKFMNFSKANCKNCYKCLRTCPVKAIKFKNDQAEIEEDRCIACGHCLSICPQNARNVQSDLGKVKYIVNSSREVIISLAPSFAGYFDVDPNKLVSGLKKLGFSYVHETAYAAELVANLYKEYIYNNSQENYITTACPSANYLIEKYYPDLIKYMIPIVSPMIAHGKLLKTMYGNDSYIVFIGPCSAKKIEGAGEGDNKVIDAVITFDELKLWLDEEKIDINSLEPFPFENEELSEGRHFPISGGIIKCIGNEFENRKIETISVEGTEDCIEMFKSMNTGKIKGMFIEISACKGSCIGGPKMIKDGEGYYSRLQNVKDYIKEKKFLESRKKISELCSTTCLSNINTIIDYERLFKNKSPLKKLASEEEISKILMKMGKYTKEDELNCGVCGYNTCREKAYAIYDGMAETSMCLHFMRSKAESLSNTIFENTPNCLILLDEDMLVKEVNPAFEKTFMINKENIIGKSLTKLIDDEDFIKVKEEKQNIIGKKVIYPKYNAEFIENIIYLPKEDVILISLTDIAEEEKNKKELLKVKKNALNAADEIINKQMRVAQDIAGILGETTAETKLILMELRKVISGETGEIK